MQRIILSELTATDVGIEEIKSRRRRGQCAFAFGRSDALAKLRYTPADAVAVMLSGELAMALGATRAAQIIRTFADVVLRAISPSKADTTGDVMLVVTDFIGADGKRTFLATAEDGRPPDATGYVASEARARIEHALGPLAMFEIATEPPSATP